MRRKFKLKRFFAVTLAFALLFTQFATLNVKAETGRGKNIVAYFPNWGTYNVNHSNFSVEKIPWDKVTVINHAFFEVDSGFKLASTDTFADFDKMFTHSEGWEANQIRGHFGEYKYFKSRYPDVKVLVSVGGWTRGQNFHAMAATSSTRAVFIKSVVEFLKKYPFIDGIDIDWEFPGIDRKADPNDEYDKGCPGGPEDKQNFTALLREIRQAYNNNGLSGKMLTIAAPAGYDKAVYQEPDVYAQYLDFINVMTYDMHGAWETTTNHHSGIYANPNDPSDTSPVDIKNRYNTDSAMKLYRDVYRIPANKLNVGTPFYSRGWKGVKNNGGALPGLFAPASGAPVGTWDNPQSPGGQNPYFKMKELEKTAGYIKYRDPYGKVPYLYNASQGVMYTYEDEESLGERCNYVINNGYGGMIIWEISGDNPSGFPMTTLISEKFKGINQDDGNNKLPAAAALSADSTTNSGSFTVTVTVPANNTATELTLYEGNNVVKTQNLTANSSAAQIIKYDVSGKSAGTYSYRADLSNQHGITPGASLVITVKSNQDGNTNPSGGYNVIGYVYGTPNNVDATKLTHINYAFAQIVNGKVAVSNPGDLAALVALKVKNPNLKVILSVGGWGGDGFSDAALTEASRNTFAESCLKVINDNKLDGIDLDWEYPVNGGWGMIKCRPEDKTNFTLMLQAVRNKIGNGKILSIASGASQEYANNTELAKIAGICDFINIMTYDFGASRHNANLYESSNYGYSISCDSAVKIHLANGVPAGKINMGMPFYGRKGNDWPTYSELVENYINKNGWTRYWDEQAKACYLLNQGQFLTYDDVESFGYKTAYIKEKGLGGAMFWQYNQDYKGTLLGKLWSDLGTAQEEPGTVPNVPQNLKVTVDGTSVINISWNASAGATGYDLKIDGVETSNVTSPYAHTGLAANSTHTYAIRAKNAKGASTWSSIVSATTKQADNDTSGSWGSRIFAPYVDVMLWPTFSINDCYEKTNQKFYTLAFITSNGAGNPAWGGITGIDTDFYADEINNIRSKGGDVIVSFGGANGIELAQSNTDAAALQSKYQSVIDKYKLTWIDFDIEGSAVADKAAVDRRNKAIKGLQARNPNLKVAFCLPVLPSGLTDDGLYVLKNAKENGVRIDVVNVMAMDYGDGQAPNPDGKMGDYAIQAARATYDQCNSLGISVKIGVTPMIGKNDVQTEVFYQSDARKLLSFAQSNSWVRLLAMWSVNRDNGRGGALYQSSNITQTDLEFTNIFKVFNTGSEPGDDDTNPPAIPAVPTGLNAAAAGTSVINITWSNSAGATGYDLKLDGVEISNVTSPYAHTGLAANSTHTYAVRAKNSSGTSAWSSTVTAATRPQIVDGSAWEAYKAYNAGDVVTYNGTAYKCIQSHTSLPGWEPSNVPALWSKTDSAPGVDPRPQPEPDPQPAKPVWAANAVYRTGDLATYNGNLYECIQAHTSLPGWEPSNVPALWSQV